MYKNNKVIFRWYNFLNLVDFMLFDNSSLKFFFYNSLTISKKKTLYMSTIFHKKMYIIELANRFIRLKYKKNSLRENKI